MSDGKEEREERDKRREWEERKDPDDLIDRERRDEWERERRESKGADSAVLRESAKHGGGKGVWVLPVANCYG